MTRGDQKPECKPWCSPKHYRFCGGACCPHLHQVTQDGKDAGRDPARPSGRTRAGV
ncbi:hypothetical protein GCM10028799_39820 [Kribbella italica]